MQTGAARIRLASLSCHRSERQAASARDTALKPTIRKGRSRPSSSYENRLRTGKGSQPRLGRCRMGPPAGHQAAWSGRGCW